MRPAQPHSRVTLLATLALLAITATWGSTFFLIHDLLDRVPVPDFLALRFTIATVAMFVVAPRAVGRLSPDRRRHAVVLGGLYGFAQILQTTAITRHWRIDMPRASAAVDQAPRPTMCRA